MSKKLRLLPEYWEVQEAINHQLEHEDSFPLLDGFCEALESALLDGTQLEASAIYEQLAFIHSAAHLIGHHGKVWVRPDWHQVAFEQAMETLCAFAGGRLVAKGLVGFTIKRNVGGSVVVDQKFLDNYAVDTPKETQAESVAAPRAQVV